MYPSCVTRFPTGSVLAVLVAFLITEKKYLIPEVEGGKVHFRSVCSFQFIAGWLQGRVTWHRGITEETQFTVARGQEDSEEASNKQQTAGLSPSSDALQATRP